jgi:hypothetical protein
MSTSTAHAATAATPTTTAATPTRHSAARSAPRSAGITANGLIAAGVVSALVNVVIAAIAHAGGAADTVRQLEITTFVPLTLIGVAAGAAGWAVVRRLSREPARVLRWLVPGMLVLSFIPDLLVSGEIGVVATAALMAMHVAIAAVAVPMYAKVLPLSAGR